MIPVCIDMGLIDFPIAPTITRSHMKTTISRTLTLAAFCFALPCLNSCQTTGDPNSGGIFWSAQKAQQRLDEREAHLNQIQGDTRAVNRRSSATQQKINQY